MNTEPLWNRIQGNWRQFAGNVQQRWGQLTDNDVAEINGNRERLIGKLQERYGIAQADANRQIDEWAENLKF
jgi:uncharacterized protein YjbJ (UPF0337 family)